MLSPSDQLELMDSAPLSGEELASALRFLAWSNRRLGGRAPVLRRFDEWSARWEPGERRTVLDVGTGGADIPMALASWAQARGFDLEITAIDSTPAVAALARKNAAGMPQIEVIDTDLDSLARQGRRFDYVMGSLFLHHVPRSQRASALRACDAMATRGMLFTDLRRSLAAWAAVGLLTALWGDRVTRSDGPLSVRRAFTLDELRALALQAGLGYLEARRHPFFRLSLGGEKERHAH